jgi:formate dehydrogenase
MKTVHTTCQICVATCGIEVTVGDDNRVERIAPDKQNPYSWRDFCGKGRTAG